jgi:hypothetical protein
MPLREKPQLLKKSDLHFPSARYRVFEEDELLIEPGGDTFFV